jgi:hypothetical protein
MVGAAVIARLMPELTRWRLRDHVDVEPDADASASRFKRAW